MIFLTEFLCSGIVIAVSTDAYEKKGENEMKYTCTVCGYVYDEEAEGVKWEDLPDDYACPLCGVGKDSFEAE